MIYLLTAIGLSPGGRSTVHIYTKQYIERYETNNTLSNTTILEECGPCPVLPSYTLAFALQPRKKHGKSSVGVEKPQVRVVCQYSVSRYKYSQERYRLSHRARYNVGINDPCMVREFSNLGRHSMLVPLASDCGVSSADRARVCGGVAATVLCRVLLETTAESGLVDN